MLSSLWDAHALEIGTAASALIVAAIAWLTQRLRSGKRIFPRARARFYLSLRTPESDAPPASPESTTKRAPGPPSDARPSMASDDVADDPDMRATPTDPRRPPRVR